MIGNETILEYFLHFLAPAIVSGIVVIFCFWLGVHREKCREKKEEEVAITRQKENVVLSLWEIGIYADQNKKAISKRTIESEGNQSNIYKHFLFTFSLDFYTAAKNSNFFNFDYKLKSYFLLLKAIITAVNKLISKYNELSGRYAEDNEAILRLKFDEKQIIKSCDTILDTYKKIIVSEYLVVPILKHVDKLEEMKKKIEEIEKEEA